MSSLTSDDENVCAPALLQHFVSVLRNLPIAYAIRIETTDRVFQHSVPSVPQAQSPADVVAPAEPGSDGLCTVPYLQN